MKQLIIDGLCGTESAKIFTVAIVSLFVFSCMMSLFPGKRHWVINKAPSLLTTLGLFGTFFGVAVGLGEFDAANIDQSVMKLLEGMKLAFWTSILGMLCAFVIHASQYIIGCFVVSEVKVRKSIDEKIHEQLLRLNDKVYRLKDNTSIVYEIQKLRESVAVIDIDVVKEIRTLKTMLDDFALKLVDYNMGALVEVLNKIVRNFDTIIDEQCGESFRQLNQAIDKLITWQKDYHNELEVMTKQFHSTSSGVDNVRKNLDAIPMIMSQLRDIVVVLDNEMKQSRETLKSLSSLRNSATDVFPTIKQALTSLTEELAASIKQSVKEMERSTKTQNDIIQKLGENTLTMATNLQTALKQGADEVQMVFAEAADNMKQSAQDSFATFDHNTTESLSKVIKYMGDNLASIHKKIFDDCEQILEDIKQLAREARVNNHE